MDLAKYSLIKEIIVLKFRDDHKILLSIDFQSAWTCHLKYIGITATFLQVTSMNKKLISRNTVIFTVATLVS